MPIDHARLQEILDAASSPAFRKFMEDKVKAEKAVADAQAHLAEVEERLANAIPPGLAALLTPAEAPRRGRRPSAGGPKAVGKKPSLQELKEILAGLPKKTLHVRKEGYDSQSIKALAEANPGLLEYQKGTWPTVRLLK